MLLVRNIKIKYKQWILKDSLVSNLEDNHGAEYCCGCGWASRLCLKHGKSQGDCSTRTLQWLDHVLELFISVYARSCISIGINMGIDGPQWNYDQD